MDTAITRFAFGLLMLLACVIATWRGAEQTPSRVVVELVSVVYKPARMEARAVGESASAQAAAPAAETNADRISPPKRLFQEPARQVVQHTEAVPRRELVAARSARTSAAVPNAVKVACRPRACRTAAPAASAAMKRAGARQVRVAEPPLPAVFVPIRKLGLYLQARLGAPPDGKGKAAPGKRKP